MQDGGAGSQPFASRRAQEQALKKHQRKDYMLYIPTRCEHAGCTATTDLSRCARCTMVLYCGAEHQKADWPRHKKECKHLTALGLWGCKYTDEEELAKFPIDASAPPLGVPG